MNLKELQAQRMELRTKAVEALEEIRKNTDEARAKELEERHDKIMAEFDQLDAKIEREQHHEATLAKFEGRMDDAERRNREGRRPGGSEQVNGNDEPGGDELSYRDVFASYIASGGRVSDMAPEHRSLLMTGYQKAQNTEGEARALVTGTGSAGGYTVPTEMAVRLIESMAKIGPMLDPDWVTVLNTANGRGMTMPTINDTDGGTKVAAHTEGGALTDDGGVDPVFGQMLLEAYGFNTEFVQISAELGQDSVLALEAILIRVLGRRLARKVNAQLTTGTGSSQPKGIVAASSLGKTAASASALATDEVIDLRDSVDEAYWDMPSCGFMLKRSTLTAVEKLKGSDGQYIWRAGDVQKGVPNTLLGFKYRTNPDMASIATGAKTILFGDMSAYFTRTVGNPLIAALQDTSNFPNVGVAGFWRADGDLGDTTAVKHLIQA